jgi:glycerophosphoryl diester phosphodiesterase
MWENLPIPAIIAHRGDSVNAPENTIPAFLSALEKGAHGIEFDVKLCLDGHVIVIHDQTLDRTTFSSGNVAK